MSNKIKWILFDLDNTLLDFSAASQASFNQTFHDYNIELKENYYQEYTLINNQLWSDFEDNKVTAADIRKLRFTRLFEKLGISDISGLTFNTDYLNNLIKLSQSYHGVPELLDSLSKNYRMSIVTNGLQEVQRPRIKKTGIGHYFESIIVSDEIGVSKPDHAFFQNVYESVNHPPELSEIMIVGDSLKSDIKGGIDFGIQTCWISHGKENFSTIEPNNTIRAVIELPEVLH